MARQQGWKVVVSRVKAGDVARPSANVGIDDARDLRDGEFRTRRNP
jgi:hypothetical protein